VSSTDTSTWYHQHVSSTDTSTWYHQHVSSTYTSACEHRHSIILWVLSHVIINMWVRQTHQH